MILRKIEYAIGRTGSRLFHIANFLRFFRTGMQNRYPICCVLHFSLNNLHRDRKPARERGIIFPGTDKAYVPCRFHMRRHPTWTPWYSGSYNQLRLFPDKVGKS